ncbi:myosin regulatory light polypeptide 9-like [Arapaima gigas]
MIFRGTSRSWDVAAVLVTPLLLCSVSAGDELTIASPEACVKEPRGSAEEHAAEKVRNPLRKPAVRRREESVSVTETSVLWQDGPKGAGPRLVFCFFTRCVTPDARRYTVRVAKFAADPVARSQPRQDTRKQSPRTSALPRRRPNGGNVEPILSPALHTFGWFARGCIPHFPAVGPACFIAAELQIYTCFSAKWAVQRVKRSTEGPVSTMSSKRAKGKTTKKRPQRATSNVFAMFDQSQIQEFKEAFNMIDQNRDGFIDKEDLHDMLASLGKNPSDEYLEGMMSEAPGPINFTMFLTMFGERLNGTDPEDVIRNAFACFDEEGSGVIHEDHLRELLTTMGDRFTDEEVDELFREAPIDKKGNFNYTEFTRILKHGAKDKDDI